MERDRLSVFRSSDLGFSVFSAGFLSVLLVVLSLPTDMSLAVLLRELDESLTCFFLISSARTARSTKSGFGSVCMTMFEAPGLVLFFFK